MVRGRRGFTLIELLTGSAVSLIVLAVAFTSFLHVSTLQRRQMELAGMKRSAALVLGQLGAELRQAGLGRPHHGRAEGTSVLFPPAILVAQADMIGFVADLPRADSNFNGYSQLADDQDPSTLPANGIALLNELNGGCDISTATTRCASNAESLLFAPGEATECATDPDSPTCPWGLNRYQGKEYLLVTNAKGNWVQRQLQNVPYATITGGRRSLVLETALPSGMLSGPNRGFVSTPDRVYYWLVGDTVKRNQCWGSVFGTGGAFAMGCPTAATDTATGWEELTTGVKSSGLRFSYWDANGNKLPLPITLEADLRRVRRVDVVLELERELPGGELLSHSTSLSITLRQ